MVGIIRDVEDNENALESIAWVINQRHWRIHLSDALLIQHQLKWYDKFRYRTLGQPLEEICKRFKEQLIHLQQAFTHCLNLYSSL